MVTGDKQSAKNGQHPFLVRKKLVQFKPKCSLPEAVGENWPFKRKWKNNTHIHFTALWTLSRITGVSQYQKGKTNLNFTEARDSEWQWHQLGHVQICTSLQTDNHASIPPLSFLQVGCPSCHSTNRVKALKISNH